MNICFILIEYPLSLRRGEIVSDFTGGAGVVMYDIAHGLKSRGHNVVVLARTIHSEHQGSFNDEGIEVHKYYAKNRVLETHNMTQYLDAIIKEREIDIIEACDYAPLLCEVPQNTPLLIRQHISHALINKYEGKLKDVYDKNNYPCFLRSLEMHLADSFSGVSNFVLNEQTTLHGLEKNKIYGVIYNGIKDSIGDRMNQESDKNMIFCHGTVSERKGTHRICHIYNEVKATNRDAKLKIIGNGKTFWDERCYNQLSGNAKKDSTYYEFRPHHEVINEISQCGIYLSMSKLEAMSISMLEAMRLGKPVVLLKNGSFEEFVDNGVEGFIVSNEKEAVSRILDLLKDDTLYKRMSQAAYQKSKQFTIERCVAETEKWYEHVISNKSKIMMNRSIHYSELLKAHYHLLKELP